MKKQYYPINTGGSVIGLGHMRYKGERVPLRNMVAFNTGEKRPPRKGEYYLSGAIVAAYRAENDLSTEYYIAELISKEEIAERKRQDILLVCDFVLNMLPANSSQHQSALRLLDEVEQT